MRITDQNLRNFAFGTWTHENDEIKSTVKMSMYIRHIGAVVIIWMTEVDTIMKLLCVKGIGSVYKRHPVTKFEHGSHGVSKRKFNHMTVY